MEVVQPFYNDVYSTLMNELRARRTFIYIDEK